MQPTLLLFQEMKFVEAFSMYESLINNLSYWQVKRIWRGGESIYEM